MIISYDNNWYPINIIGFLSAISATFFLPEKIQFHADISQKVSYTVPFFWGLYLFIKRFFSLQWRLKMQRKEHNLRAGDLRVHRISCMRNDSLRTLDNNSKTYFWLRCHPFPIQPWNAKFAYACVCVCACVRACVFVRGTDGSYFSMTMDQEFELFEYYISRMRFSLHKNIRHKKWLFLHNKIGPCIHFFKTLVIKIW